MEREATCEEVRLLECELDRRMRAAEAKTIDAMPPAPQLEPIDEKTRRRLRLAARLMLEAGVVDGQWGVDYRLTGTAESWIDDAMSDRHGGNTSLALLNALREVLLTMRDL